MVTARPTTPGTRRFTRHIVYELARSIRERDVFTYEHCRRVGVYVSRLAREMGWSRRAAHDLALAALVHDLGKTWIQNAILHKDAPLSTDERAEIERHPEIAANLLRAYGAPEMLVQAVRHHHEAYNGRGYPDGLAGEAIPQGARLLSVGDVFDVITSERSYKPALDVAAARERLLAAAGVQLDPAAVEAFVRLLDRAPDFVIPPRVSPLPLRPAPSPTWIRHDTFED
ncbi:MAG TPA: HD domain-containing phosphohydrolase [Ktedonobacterales bacterium]|nr:HD domain-containing phosphohydrolase [Ktedonobacterales bacterium]